MYEVEIKLGGVVVATIKWSSHGGHNTTIKGVWGEMSCACNSLQETFELAQRKIAGIQ